MFTGIGKVKSIKRTGSTVEYTCANGRVRVQVLSDSIVRVRATRAAAFGPEFSYAVPRKPTGKISTKNLKVTIQKSPFRIEFADANGAVLNADEARGMGWDGEKPRSYRRLAADEMFFGCGEKTGQLNKRGQSFAFWNTDNPTHTYLNGEVYVSIPFLISTRGYGIFWDNTDRSFFNLGQGDEKSYWLEADTGEIDYYFIAGNVKQVVRAYAGLTGRMTMPPRWALGFQQCRWSYMSAEEITGIARNFRKRKIPCDVIYCDIDYMDGYRVWTWNPKSFPNPRKFVKTLRNMGFHLVTIIDPGVKNDDGYVVCREAKEQGMLVKKPDGTVFVGDVWPGPSVFPDFTNPRVRQWWGKWHKEFLDIGVAGFWNDMNEPAVFNGPDHSMPLDNLHDYDGQGATHKRAHNVYGFNMARACHEGVRALRPNQRPFVITRSAFAGIQRYSMVWTGDNHSTWEQYELSIRQCLNLSLSGVPFCGPDVGGFSWDTTGELLARWTQAGAFFPFFRNHTATGTRAQEPWTFGREVQSACRKAITLRYRLLPYLYGVFREAAQHATPIMRPLFWEFPDDPHGYSVDDEFLLGPSLLVAPVLRRGARQRAVYLPAGAEWYAFGTDRKQTGGQFVTATAPLDTIPLFVRAGTILPMTEAIQHTGESAAITLHIYPGKQTTGILYEDDGASFDYTRGKYSLTQFRWANGKLQIQKKKTGYKGAKQFRVVVAGG